MGYYDDHYPPNPHRKKSKSHVVLTLIAGVILGVLFATIVLPNLKNRGPNVVDDAQQNGVTSQKGTSENINVDVTSQITSIVADVAPTVVGISNLQRSNNLWDPQQEASEAASGSGVIYKKDNKYAYIVTNYHVISGADEIEVILNDNTSLKANLLGGDIFSDLAVLQVDEKKIDHVIEMGSSDDVKVGEPVIAVGNPLGLMFAGSVTQGIISGKQRTIPQDFNNDGRVDWQAEVIQTDAAINPGNSGGALINISGKLIGINSMKINEAAVEGIGFSIPIDTAYPIISELEKTGKVVRPYLGVEIYSLQEVPRQEWKNTLNLPKQIDGGVYVWSVEPFSPADKAGMKRLDVITSLDGKDVNDMIDLRKILYQEKKIGDTLDVIYYRDGKKHEAKIKLGKQE
ncbi:S1C family serine protease [Virgibacillus soli]|uniref:Trypsin-like peptidase domain-containing protein n=1 Tax=Paracerasibacillus soli TaxID=480284 RepID=A0ABU5CU60_9BACI|nr:trypsin-like peptidase domain-containing protein [Virgibacillus soli]MDY0409908.1 trypsin-like peptidase domain-containing protein [Virgibacillus soli]